MFVLLDSNVWLAALAHDGFCRRVSDAAASVCTFITTPFICAEVGAKLVTKFGRTQAQAHELIVKITSVSLLRADTAELAAPLRDPNDQPILAAAVANHCQFLVTGDRDLLSLGKYDGVEIVSVRAFAERLNLNVS